MSEFQNMDAWERDRDAKIRTDAIAETWRLRSQVEAQAKEIAELKAALAKLSVAIENATAVEFGGDPKSLECIRAWQIVNDAQVSARKAVG